MNKKEGLPTAVFELYEVKTHNADQQKNGSALRKYLNRQFKQEYPEKQWDELTDVEKDVFLYVTIQDKMLNNYTVKNGAKPDPQLSRKIKKAAREKLLLTNQAYEDIKSQEEEQEDKRFKTYGEAEYFSDLKKYRLKLEKAYEEFKENWKEVINDEYPVPEFNKWFQDSANYIQRTKEGNTELRNVNQLPSGPYFLPQELRSLRIHDYVMKLKAEQEEQERSSRFDSSGEAINYILFVLRILSNIVEDVCNIEIDYDKINEIFHFASSLEQEAGEELSQEEIEKRVKISTNKDKIYKSWLKDISNFYTKKSDSKT